MNLEDIVYYINVFFFIYMFIYAIVFFFTTSFSAINLDDFFIRKKHMSYSMISNKLNYIPISILVPAYNEEITIIETINSLMDLDYPEYEIIVINDGSDDKTLEKVIEHFNLSRISKPFRKLVNSEEITSIYENQSDKKIVLVNKENGGKSDALNAGINISKYPLFVCVDADSMLQKNSLERIVQPFLEDSSTIAVGGNIKVSNQIAIKNGEIKNINPPKKSIVLFQIIEYFRVFLNSRVFFDRLNANLIISGAFGIYRKSAVINVGGYTKGLIGEDMEIVVKMHAFYRKNKLPYKMNYVPDAICWTQVPESLKILKNQRVRWHIGMGESLRRHKYMFLNTHYGLVGMLSFPYFLFFEFISPILEILGVSTITISFLIGIINFRFFIFYLLFYIGFNVVISIISVLLEKYLFKKTIPIKFMFKLFIFCMLESFGYRQICSLYKIIALFKLKDKKWGQMERVEQKY